MDLMTKTFLIIGGMLIITTIAARFNKALETKTEATIAICGSFLTLFICFILADKYPINLWACAAFSGFTGWILGPAVGNIGYALKFGPVVALCAWTQACWIASNCFRRVRIQRSWNHSIATQ